MSLTKKTTDKKVNQVTPKLFKLAKVPEAMAGLELELIKDTIKEIGLAPTKAKNLKKMAEQLLESGGMRPDWDFLENLAGVGHKTASVVMSQWYGVPAFPIDTHIHRLAARWGLSKAKNVEMTERDLKRLWPEEEWNKRHLQIKLDAGDARHLLERSGIGAHPSKIAALMGKTRSQAISKIISEFSDTTSLPLPSFIDSNLAPYWIRYDYDENKREAFRMSMMSCAEAAVGGVRTLARPGPI